MKAIDRKMSKSRRCCIYKHWGFEAGQNAVRSQKLPRAVTCREHPLYAVSVGFKLSPKNKGTNHCVFCFLSRKGAEATADEYQEIPLLQKGRVNFLEPVTTRNGERLLSDEKRNNRSWKYGEQISTQKSFLFLFSFSWFIPLCYIWFPSHSLWRVLKLSLSHLSINCFLPSVLSFSEIS